MIKPRMLLFLVLFAFSGVSAFGSASNAYVTSTGGAVGNCPSGSTTFTPAQFNNSSNWGSGSTQIGAGTTVLLCGTITGATNATILSFQGSGTSGNPITLKFDTGAIVQTPACNANGCIYSSGNNYLTINGGTNGLIQNTSNGTSGSTSCLSGSCSVQQDSAGVQLVSCTGCTVENLTIADMYVRTSTSDENGYGTCIEVKNNSVSGTTNTTIQNNTVYDSLNGIYVAYGTSDSGLTISGNTVYHVNWGIAVNGQSTNNAVTGAVFSRNIIHDLVTWNDPGPYNFHHNGIVLFSGNTNTSISAVVYSNYFYGDFGDGTAVFDVQNSDVGTDSVTFFNNYANLSATTGTTGGDGCIYAENDDASGSVIFKVYNNTCVGVGTMYGIEAAEPGITTVAENNITVGWGSLFATQDSAPLPTTMNYNDWYLGSGTNLFNANGQDYSSISSWHTATGLDVNSISTNPLLNPNGTLQSGSPAMLLGTNLTSLCSGNLTALCSDNLGSPRPSTGAGNWAAGAFQSTAGAPDPPTNLTAVAQ